MACRLLLSLDDTLEEALRAKLADRAAADRPGAALTPLDANGPVLVQSVVLLGGYLVDEDMAAAGAYDLRFLEQRLLITPANGWRPLIDIPTATSTRWRSAALGPSAG